MSKLTYFGLRGRAEQLRLTFVVAGIEYEDHRVDFQQFGEMKPNLPFGQLPIFHDDIIGTIAQTKAILRYISQKHHLDGHGERERAQVDMYCEFIRDVREAIDNNLIFNENSKKEDTRNQVWTEKVLPLLNKLNGVIQENGYLVGNSVTVADVIAFDVLVNVAGPFNWEETLKLKNILHLIRNITGLERVRNYLKSEKLNVLTAPPLPFVHYLNKPEQCVYPDKIFG
jgi:glutathione S-transferase